MVDRSLALLLCFIDGTDWKEDERLGGGGGGVLKLERLKDPKGTAA